MVLLPLKWPISFSASVLVFSTSSLLPWPDPPRCVSGGLISLLGKAGGETGGLSDGCPSPSPPCPPCPPLPPHQDAGPRPLLSSHTSTFVAERSGKTDQWASQSIGQSVEPLEGQRRSIPTLLHCSLRAFTSWSLAIKPDVVPAPLPPLGNNN